jgi:diadenosine tetraphosphatase ApaH/serine/threonine PP2A family protein phosphatase
LHPEWQTRYLLEIEPECAYLINPGSVGQPRDGDPAASFAMFDTASREITYCRVPYDVDAAAKRIRDNGLPNWLADRLLVGR